VDSEDFQIKIAKKITVGYSSQIHIFRKSRRLQDSCEKFGKAGQAQRMVDLHAG
jgi:hypothetical protein